MICCWYGSSHGGFVGIGIDWLHGFVAIKQVLLAVADCLYPVMALDIAPWYLEVLLVSFGIATVMVVWCFLLLNTVMHG